MIFGIHDKSRELIIGTQDGAIRSRKHRRMGSHERWNSDEVNAVEGLPWLPNPQTEGTDLMPGAFMPQPVPVILPEASTRPIQARGSAVTGRENVKMGPAPGRHGRKAIALSDSTRKRRGPERRSRLIKRLKRQGRHNIQG